MTRKIHAIVLASGLSRRLGGYNKLLLPCPGQVLLAEIAMRAVNEFETIENSTGVESKTLGKKILIYSDERVGALAQRHGFTAVKNTEYAEGRAAGIRLAAQIAPQGSLLFLSGDLCGVDGNCLTTLIAAAQKNTDAVFSKTSEGFGSPSLFSENTRPYLVRLCGEQGGKIALKYLEEERGPARVTFATTKAEQCADIDTWNDYLNFITRAGIRNLFITGERGAGKSTLIKHISEAAGPFDGIRTILNRTQRDAENYLYLERILTKEKMLAARMDKTTKKLTAFFPEAFDCFAIEQLKQVITLTVQDSLAGNKPVFILLDELGRIEADCHVFYSFIRTVLNRAQNEPGGVNLIAVLQNGDIAFNQELLARNDSLEFSIK